MKSINKKNLHNYLPFSIQYYCPILKTVQIHRFLYMLNHYLLDPDPELYFRIWFWIRGKVSDPDPQHWTFSEAGADPKWSGSPTLAKCTCLLCLFWILIHGLSCFGSVFLFLIRIQWLNSSVADPDIGQIRIFFPDPDPDAAKSERAYILNCVF